MKIGMIGLILYLLLPGIQAAARTENGAGAPAWEYRMETTNPGSRSEGVLGRLYYRGGDIGYYFHTVIIGDTEYRYAERRQLWQFGGYARMAAPRPVGRAWSWPILKAELERGWYAGAHKARKPRTPADWIWVERDGFAAFVRPDALPALAAARGFTPL